MKRKAVLGFSLFASSLLIMILFALLARPATALTGAIITVNSAGDTGAAPDCNDGTCELREAVAIANGNPGPDTVLFDLADNSSIVLTQGHVNILDTLTIDGGNVVSLTISGNNASKLFEINANVGVTMTQLILRDGGLRATEVWQGNLTLLDCLLTANNIALAVHDGAHATLDGVTVRDNNGFDNGGILNWGSLTVRDSVFAANSAVQSGGAIYNDGTVTVMDSTFVGNSAGNGGGAIYNGGAFEGGDLTVISNSTFSGNSAGETGGAIANSRSSSMLAVTTSTFSGNSAGQSGGAIGEQGTINVTNSVFTGNSAGQNGGGIFANGSGALQVVNVTVSGNSAISGGGIYNSGAVTLTNSTIAANTASAGAGGYQQGDGTTTLQNSILANSVTGADCVVSGGSLADGGGNLVEDGSCGIVTSGDPLLGVLQDNGGATQTHALLVGSPAIDAAEDAACPATDQRGYARPTDGDGDGIPRCDVGAFEAFQVFLDPSRMYLPAIFR